MRNALKSPYPFFSSCGLLFYYIFLASSNAFLIRDARHALLSSVVDPSSKLIDREIGRRRSCLITPAVLLSTNEVPNLFRREGKRRFRAMSFPPSLSLSARCVRVKRINFRQQLSYRTNVLSLKAIYNDRSYREARANDVTRSCRLRKGADSCSMIREESKRDPFSGSSTSPTFPFPPSVRSIVRVTRPLLFDRYTNPPR